MSSSMVPISLRDPFWDDPHFSSSRQEFDDMRRQMMREAKDFWSRVDDDSLSSGRLRDDLEDDLDLRRRFYSNPATAVPGWMMPRREGGGDVAAGGRCGWTRGDNQLLRIGEDDTKFEITLDVHSYRPDEIKVRTTPDNTVVVEAKHEERSGNTGAPSPSTGSNTTYYDRGLSGLYGRRTCGDRSAGPTAANSSINSSSNVNRNYSSVLQQFSRTYSLPPSCDPMRVVSNLSRDGILVVTAPKRQPVKATTGGGGGNALDRSIPVRH